MEISSLRPVYWSNFKDHPRHEKPQEESGRTGGRIWPVPEETSPDEEVVDFSDLTPRQLRATAETGFNEGQLDDGSFFALLEGLPDKAIDRNGAVIDLSGVRDDSPFDFRSFYENQLAVAQSLGDPASAQVLAGIIAFMDRRQGRR